MAKIFVAGHKGMVGSAICRLLSAQDNEIITACRADLDLIDQRQVDAFFAEHKFEQVYLAAAKVGGIHANDVFPAQFIYENLSIQSNVIHAAYKNSVSRLLFLGSSCIYPKFAEQPISEDSLLSGPLEPTNEPYGIAKIAGIKMCESYNRQYGCDFRSVMPTNLYGPGDNYHAKNSHVVPALIRRFYEARCNDQSSVSVWGSGIPRREFLHVDDMAAACLRMMSCSREEIAACTNPRMSHINVGTGIDHSISDLAELIGKVVGFKGDIIWDPSMPDGTPRKLLDTKIIASLGWRPSMSLRDGLKDAYRAFLAETDQVAKWD
ncbi:GDP-L-fucose synthase [Gammaproteobacteria bacterium]|nr:GDP-L-fucose synthase [Gammaproteobacteria bacterium]